MSSQSRLMTPYKAPGYVTLHKRKHASGDSQEEIAEGKSSHKKRIAQTRAPSDSENSDEEMYTPMSESQLNRHSKVPVSANIQVPDPGKLMDAKLERIALKSRAAQHKENRSHPLPAQATFRASGTTSNSQSGGRARYIMCLWRAPQTRKHKTWDGDACLILGLNGTGNRLIDASNKQCLARDFKVRSSLEPGEVLMIGSKEIEVDRDISEKEYRTGRPDTTPQAPFKAPSRTVAVPVPVQPQVPDNESNRQFKSPSKLRVRGQRIEVVTPEVVKQTAPAAISSVPVKSFYAKLPNDAERVSKVKPSGLFNSETGETPKARHDPDKLGSIVMARPNLAHQTEHNKKNLKIVDVVVNPILATSLRPHQIEGVRFLYEKVMGMRANEDDDSFGAILADEMGLGKTLQTITVIDMLLNQNCYDTSTRRAIDRALVVCPLSLVKNWAREFKRWAKHIKVQCISDKNKIGNTIYGNFQVLIIGYEKLLNSYEQVAKVQPKFGLLVCDEAHRLKNQAAKTSQMFANIAIDRRILLTGTPIQNNLLEFHAMIDLVSPNLLSNKKTFKKAFEEPILKSRLPNCTREERQLGKERSDILQTITQGILLRRTADLLSDFLPPKHEQVIFCSPSPTQVKLYELLINSDRVHDIVSGSALHSFALTAIGILIKLCNSPELLVKERLTSDNTEEGATTKALLSSLRKYMPTSVSNMPEMSGKLLCVTRMLLMIRKQTTDKVVLISNYTSTLDIFEAICRKSKFTFVRMDGKTKQNDRINIINSFNQSDQASQFIFLLSKRTGGAGINLIGANRLILFDTDWNPSNDRQAMARIHRDGQKKPCYIYRILIPGTMDEKIYQRQISKLSLSDSLIDNKGKSGKSSESFTPEELRSIFQLHLDTRCLSHDQMRCTCKGNGVAGAGQGEETEERDKDDDGEDSDDDATPPPLTFRTASQLHASQAKEQKKDSEAKLSALLRWAHHDCTSESSAPTQDSILNDLISRQHQKGMYTDDDQDPDNFDMTKVKTGLILYVYAEASRKKQEDLSEISEISDEGEASQDDEYD